MPAGNKPYYDGSDAEEGNIESTEKSAADGGIMTKVRSVGSGSPS